MIARIRTLHSELSMNNPTDYVYVPLPVDLYAELILRRGDHEVAHIIANVVGDFLERTEGDPDMWSSEYLDRHADDEANAFKERFGTPSRGYQWQNVFLPNGTEVRMTYRGTATHAEVRHERLCLGEDSMTPSEFAKRVANNTNRNAWRDIYVKFPGTGAWKFADDLRRQGK